jgi:hypothetical protein
LAVQQDTHVVVGAAEVPQLSARRLGEGPEHQGWFAGRTTVLQIEAGTTECGLLLRSGR